MSPLGRRRFLVILPSSVLTLACGQPSPSCKEPAPSKLSRDQIAVRDGVGYKHVAPVQERLCRDCHYYKSGEDCGTCDMMPGPTSPTGTCNLFRKKS